MIYTAEGYVGNPSTRVAETLLGAALAFEPCFRTSTLKDT